MQNSLKRLRESKQWTLKRLSQESGIPVSTISHIEHGKNASLEILQKIATAIGTSVEELMKQGPELLQEVEKATMPVACQPPENHRAIRLAALPNRIQTYLDGLSNPAFPESERAEAVEALAALACEWADLLKSADATTSGAAQIVGESKKKYGAGFSPHRHYGTFHPTAFMPQPPKKQIQTEKGSQ